MQAAAREMPVCASAEVRLSGDIRDLSVGYVPETTLTIDVPLCVDSRRIFDGLGLSTPSFPNFGFLAGLSGRWASRLGGLTLRFGGLLRTGLRSGGRCGRFGARREHIFKGRDAFCSRG